MNLKLIVPLFALMLIGAVTLMEDDAYGSQVAPSGSTQVGDLYYKVTDGTAMVTGVSSTTLTSIVIPDSVTIDGTSYPVTSTTNDLCSRMTQLTSVTIGNSLTTIGGYAFDGCTALSSVTLGNSVETIKGYVFRNCTSLASISLSSSLSSIEFNAFENCTALESIVIPDSVQIIKGSTFSGCTSLTSVTLGNSVKTLESQAFTNCPITSMDIPASVTSVSAYTFSNCNSMAEVNVSPQNANYSSVDGILFNKDQTSIVYFPPAKPVTDYVVPDSVTDISLGAFSKCGLESVVIGDSVVSIGNSAFSNSSSLTYVSIGASASFKASNQFSGCTSLDTVVLNCSEVNKWFYGNKSITTVILGNNVTNIGNTAFKNCTSLASLSFGNSITTINEGAFSGCTSLTSVFLPDSVTTINYGAFTGCISLAVVKLGSSTELASQTFSGCTALQSVDLGNAPSLGYSSFQGCTSLSSIVIPANVRTIESNSFSGCTNLKKVLNLSSMTIKNNSFGMNADEIRSGADGFDAISMLQDVGEPESTKEVQVADSGPIPSVLALIPVTLIMGLAVSIIAYFRFKN